MQEVKAALQDESLGTSKMSGMAVSKFGGAVDEVRKTTVQLMLSNDIQRSFAMCGLETHVPQSAADNKMSIKDAILVCEI